MSDIQKQKAELNKLAADHAKLTAKCEREYLKFAESFVKLHSTNYALIKAEKRFSETFNTLSAPDQKKALEGLTAANLLTADFDGMLREFQEKLKPGIVGDHHERIAGTQHFRPDAK